MTEGTFELANCTNTLLSEIADHTFQRPDIAQTYALAMRSSESTDWAAVNAAIVKRWTLSALEWIKRQSHSGRCFEERKAPKVSTGEQKRIAREATIETMTSELYVEEVARLHAQIEYLRGRSKRHATTIARLEALAEQRRVDLVAMRGQG